MKRSAIVRVLPSRWRERYGAEIDEHLAGSQHPVADLLDVVKQGIRWHLEAVMRSVWKASAIVLGMVSLIALGYATNDLAGGITELPKHWWSMAPLLGLALAGGLGLLGRSSKRREARR